MTSKDPAGALLVTAGPRDLHMQRSISVTVGSYLFDSCMGALCMTPAGACPLPQQQAPACLSVLAEVPG